MNDADNECDDDVVIDTICVGCDLTLRVNDLGLCDECFAGY